MHMTSSTQLKNHNHSELYGIQILRAVAALAVVLHHALEQSNGAANRFSPDWFTTAGASGVDIFFVISGFIMLHVSFLPRRPIPRPGSFLFRRATRIYPLYWLCCIAILAISSAGYLSSHAYSLIKIVSSFLLLPGNIIIGVSWTLVYEMYFYLIFASTLWFRSPAATTFIVTFFIATIFLTSSLMQEGTLSAFFSNPISLEFCMGLGLAYVYSRWRRRGWNWPVPIYVAPAGLILLALATLYVEHPDTGGLPFGSRTIFWGIPALLVVAGSLNVGAPRSGVGRFWVLVGDASYAIYLTHVFLMIGYGRAIKATFIGHMHQLPFVVVVVVAAASVGLATHVVVEKPLLALIRRITRRQPARTQPE